MLVAITLFLSLGLDTLAVAIGLGLSGLPRAQWRRVGLTFALFEGGMPILGLIVGHHLSTSLGQWAGYGAAVLLMLIGAHEIKESLSDNDDDDEHPPSVEGRKLILTGLSVSLDELAVGFSLGVGPVSVGPALAYIAIQAFALTFIGLRWGTKIGKRFGEKAELLGGIVLVILGLAILINQITRSHFL